MLNPNAQKWVDALRSGKYTQGQYSLHPTDDTFCCLGVACDLFAKENPTEGRWRGNNFVVSGIDSSHSSLPRPVDDWLGLARQPGAIAYLANAHATYGPASGQTLVQDNDTCRFTFAKIANTIESHQKELFNA